MAATDERARHELYLAVEDLIGAEKADTLMAALPASDRIELATTSDLDALEGRLVAQIHGLRAEMHDQLRGQFRSMLLGVIVAVGAMNSAAVAAVAAFTG
ncbi:hypothetical protein BH20ACT2_BH20ACT2_18580 [soil metagenome]